MEKKDDQEEKTLWAKKGRECGQHTVQLVPQVGLEARFLCVSMRGLYGRGLFGITKESETEFGRHWESLQISNWEEWA